MSPHLKVHAFGLFQCIEEALKGLAKVIKSCDFIRFERLADRTQLDVSDLASGVYFLTLRSPAIAATTRRFVVAGGEWSFSLKLGATRKLRPEAVRVFSFALP